MSNKKLEIVNQYFEYFYKTFDPIKLGTIFSDKLKFTGPLYSFESADDYIQSLILDPPENMNYELSHVFESELTVCTVYTFRKKSIEIEMCQLFAFNTENKICEIKLIFDTSRFKK